jgi:flavin-dependent dehydrogenase
VCTPGFEEVDARRDWDAIVIGAGPAGAVSALLLARAGWRVLLVERSAWPREKACGGCLSASCVASLRSIGLHDVLARATRVTSSHVHSGRRSARLPIDDGFAIDRTQFDAELVDRFVRAGGTFVDHASATLLTDTKGDHRTVRVQRGEVVEEHRASLALAADGLAGLSIATEPWAQWSIARDAYLGAATTLDDFAVDPGEIHMHVGTGGYVGAVKYDDGRVHLAAALNPTTCRDAGGPGVLMESILRSCGQDVSLTGRRLRGSPTLTRERLQLGGHRVLCVGDACGYVEPFTGEGIAWAVRSAIDVTRLVANGWSADLPGAWRELRDASLRRKQDICRVVRRAARSPLAMRLGIDLLRALPSLSRIVTSASTPTASAA